MPATTRPPFEATHMLEGIWPVDESAHLTPRELIAEALENLPSLAREKRAIIDARRARVSVRLGRDVRGSGGAALVVHALVPAIAKGAPTESGPYTPTVARTAEPLPAPVRVLPYNPRARRVVETDPTTAEKQRIAAAYAKSAAARHDPHLATV